MQKGQIDHSAAEANITRRAPLIPKPKVLIEKRTRRGGDGSHSKGTGEGLRRPHVTDLKTVSGLKVAFNEGDYGEQNPFYLVKQDGRTITVTYNREHPFWREFLEHASDPKVVAILDYLVFAMANSGRQSELDGHEHGGQGWEITDRDRERHRRQREKIQQQSFLR